MDARALEPQAPDSRRALVPGLIGLIRPFGVAGRDLEPLALEDQGVHLLVQEETG